MERGNKIVIIENSMPGAAKLSLHLSRLGYDITGIFSRLQEAARFIKKENPDLILMHDKFTHQMNDIEVLNDEESSPVIFFNNDDKLQERRKAFPVKNNVRRQILKEEIKKAFRQLRKKYNLKKLSHQGNPLLPDRIFVRHKDRMVKISLNDIQFVEADRNYCKLYTKSRHYLVVTTLKQIANKLPNKTFIRIHRSYIANLSHIDEIGHNYVVISSRSLPINKNMRAELFKHFQVV